MIQKIILMSAGMALIQMSAHAAPAPAQSSIQDILTNEVKQLFVRHCPDKCLDVSVNVNSKISVSRSIAEPGFEELSGGIQKSTAVTGIEVKILVDQSLPQKTKSFLETVIAYWGEKVHAPIAVTFTPVRVPSKPLQIGKKVSAGIFPILLVLLGVGLIGAGLIWFRKRKYGIPIFQSKHDGKVNMQTAQQPVSQIQVPQVSQGASLPTGELNPEIEGALADLALNHMEGVKKVLARWSATQEGLHKVVQVLTHLPISFRQEFRGVMGEKEKDQLRELYLKSANIPRDQVKTVYEDLKREIDFDQLLMAAEVKEDNFFNFLEQFDAVKIVHLVKTEDIKSRALVLLQLDPDKRAVVFDSFPIDEQKKMAHELSRLDTINGREIKDLSRRLSQRASQLAQIDLRQTSGFETLVSLIENKGDPEHFISELTHSDIKLGTKLKNSIVSLDLVEWMEDDELSLYLSQLNRDELVQLLAGRFEQYQDLIFPKLTPQLTEYVRYHLEDDMRKKITKAHMKKSERHAYDILKSMFQNGQLQLEDIHQRKTMWNPTAVAPVPTKEI